jgi:hypothetical protein
MDACLYTLDLHCTSSDAGIYIKHTDKSSLFLVLYIDDIMIFRSNLAQVLELKKALSMTFEMMDLSETKTYLGLEVTHDHMCKTLTLCQS